MLLETDFIVIGSGVAGLRASIELARTGARVAILTKDKTSESNTEYAQGGVAVVLSDDDNAELHEEDTLYAGAGLCDVQAVETLVVEGTKYIQDLSNGEPSLTAKAGDWFLPKKPRIRAGGFTRARRFDRQGNRAGFNRPRRQEKTILLMPFANTESLIVEGADASACAFSTRFCALRERFSPRLSFYARAARDSYFCTRPIRGGDRRRNGDGLFCGRGNGGYGVRSISSDRLEFGKRAEVFTVGSDARRRRDFA
jgi:glycine/D-amino acid oxidase-like deaminating enzyme